MARADPAEPIDPRSHNMATSNHDAHPHPSTPGEAREGLRRINTPQNCVGSIQIPIHEVKTHQKPINRYVSGAGKIGPTSGIATPVKCPDTRT